MRRQKRWTFTLVRKAGSSPRARPMPILPDGAAPRSSLADRRQQWRMRYSGRYRAPRLEPGNASAYHRTRRRNFRQWNGDYNVLRQRGIDTLFYMGVHANMCILNRSFGIRQLARWGIHCILVRDLTDAMYEPSSRPFVSHAAGTELVIQYIEQHWAPTITSVQFMQALPVPSPSRKIPGKGN